ncbi:undecaprenyl-phosphate glucose phosphotransferase [Bradyrhizobium xenonodulans]|uniref:Undecaprenyl-phosphate glucose phosphotransferase n=1 Tax=Bradyrhizobium xenonodulans TaxID=2736875 RepID=A0ABY7MX49_9BRAD|nr:undecaprenyl-phosphate glucose phosphotransferase [Bradyrhizobium xenonodulans]
MVGTGLYQIVANSFLDHLEPVLGIGPVAALLYVLIGYATGLYDLRAALAKKRRDSGRIFAQWTLVILLLTSLAFLMKSGAVYSRGSVICFSLLAPLLLVGCRRFAKRIVAGVVADGQVKGLRAVLLGTGEELAALGFEELLEKFGFTEVERVAFPTGRGGGFAMSAGEAATLEHAIGVARIRGAEAIVLAFPWSDTRKVELVRDGLRISPLPVRLLPDRRIRSLAGNPSFRLQNSLSVEIQRGPLSRAEQASKRLLDIVGALVGLVVFAPLMILSAIVVKLDSPGPVFFRQKRNGFNAKEFSIFKFRTMTVMEDGATVVQAKRFDPRVTRFGRLLRRSSIDEVPQLINVLMGDMSLVGPRPHALAHDSHYGRLLSDYAFRHHVKPGITGWAQVKGYRGETALVEQMKGRIDCDLWYINNWSLTLDLKILSLTCLELTSRRNAY